MEHVQVQELCRGGQNPPNCGPDCGHRIQHFRLFWGVTGTFYVEEYIKLCCFRKKLLKTFKMSMATLAEYLKEPGGSRGLIMPKEKATILVRNSSTTTSADTQTVHAGAQVERLLGPGCGSFGNHIWVCAVLCSSISSRTGVG